MRSTECSCLQWHMICQHSCFWLFVFLSEQCVSTADDDIVPLLSVVLHLSTVFPYQHLRQKQIGKIDVTLLFRVLGSRVIISNLGSACVNLEFCRWCVYVCGLGTFLKKAYLVGLYWCACKMIMLLEIAVSSRTLCIKIVPVMRNTQVKKWVQ